MTEAKRANPSLIGLGLRPELWDWTIEHAASLRAVELVVDDVMHLSPAMVTQHVAPLREAGLEILVHGVDLSLASSDGPDPVYVGKVARILDAVGAEVYGEHCSYHRCRSMAVGQFMPVPFTAQWAERVASNVTQVQTILGRKMLIENIAYLTEHPHQGLGEAAFYAAVCDLADCGLLLDLENTAVNAANLGYDALDFLAGIPLERVRQVHLAGGHTASDGTVVDSHSRPVTEDVLRLLRAVAPHMATDAVVVIERDKDYPTSWEPLAEEIARVRRCLETADDPDVAVGTPLQGGLDMGADDIEPERYQMDWLAEFQTGGQDRGSSSRRTDYVAAVDPRRRAAFARILRTKRRDKLEPLLPGTWRCLGEAQLLDGLLREWYRAQPRQDLSRAAEVAGFCAAVAASDTIPPAIRALAEHEATLVELRHKPFVGWRHRLFPLRRERSSQFSPSALDAVAGGAELPGPLPRTARIRYTRRAQGVWVEEL